MMINTNNTHEEDLELYDLYLSWRNPKILKNPKGYYRVRDRKSKYLYEYEYEEDEDLDDYDTEETRLF